MVFSLVPDITVKSSPISASGMATTMVDAATDICLDMDSSEPYTGLPLNLTGFSSFP